MPEMSKSDQVRAIGGKLCRFLNGSPCLCLEKDRPLCTNVRAVAIECWDLAHQTEMTRADHNASNKFGEKLEHGAVGTKSTGPKKVRKGR